PLAYGVLAHNRFEQLLLSVASVYESHNIFCIAIPSNADQQFIHLVHGLQDCFPNVHVLQTGPVGWGSYAIMRATYDCMELVLKQRTNRWKYFQYLSGVDAPLRTNLEMVKIMNEWKGISHVLTIPFSEGRLGPNINKTKPLKLFKTSLSAIISREAAEMMISHPKAKKLIEFLRPTRISDESFWASALGNPDLLPLRGSFNATEYLTFTKRYAEELKKLTEENKKKKGVAVYPKKCGNPPCLSRGFVGRFQTWVRKKCKGSWTNGSCVYGVDDLPLLIQNAAFVAHKFYIDFEPAALFCVLKEIDRRRSNPHTKFNFKQYNQLPQIEFSRGKKYENLTRRDLIY
ncbi:hypothetical protein PFISCL1PPCAC_19446, partial [Pristionchus fissidentatus]